MPIMSSATFDTLAATRMLQDNGIADKHAEAIVKMTAAAVHDGVATKSDIAEVKTQIAELEARLTNRLYFGLAATIAILTFVMKFT